MNATQPAVLDEPETGAETTEQIEESEKERRVQAASMDEDPEAQRRTILEAAPEVLEETESSAIDFYGSVRIHAINNYDLDTGKTESTLGDGASRIGLRGDWNFHADWWMFGRAETGFDILEQFSAGGTGSGDSSGKLQKRLLYGGVESENLQAVYGKNWSAYYQIAGMADKFAIFGGRTVGIYNANTDGGATGTGRADDALSLRLNSNALKAIGLKPFRLNAQYQDGQPIPGLQNRAYGRAVGISTWLETLSEYGIGLAYHRAAIDDTEDPLIRQAGLDGDATAKAVAFRSFGDNWYASLVVARHENVETTDRGKYVNGYGVELYGQWRFGERWWLVTGGNWLSPDDDDPDAGRFAIRYGVLGLRYTFDSFRRMVYAEYRLDNSSTFDGSPLKDELTIGIKWDF